MASSSSRLVSHWSSAVVAPVLAAARKDRGLPEVTYPAGTDVVRVRIHEDEPATLSVPGAYLELPANRLAPGTEIELASTPIEASDYEPHRFAGETPVSPMITLRSNADFESPRYALRIGPASTRSDELSVRYRTRIPAQGCIVEGPLDWDIDPLRDYNADVRDGVITFTGYQLPTWHTFVAVEGARTTKGYPPRPTKP